MFDSLTNKSRCVFFKSNKHGDGVLSLKRNSENKWYAQFYAPSIFPPISSSPPTHFGDTEYTVMDIVPLLVIYEGENYSSLYFLDAGSGELHVADIEEIEHTEGEFTTHELGLYYAGISGEIYDIYSDTQILDIKQTIAYFKGIGAIPSGGGSTDSSYFVPYISVSWENQFFKVLTPTSGMWYAYDSSHEWLSSDKVTFNSLVSGFPATVDANDPNFIDIHIYIPFFNGEETWWDYPNISFYGEEGE